MTGKKIDEFQKLSLIVVTVLDGKCFRCETVLIYDGLGGKGKSFQVDFGFRTDEVIRLSLQEVAVELS